VLLQTAANFAEVLDRIPEDEIEDFLDETVVGPVDPLPLPILDAIPGSHPLTYVLSISLKHATECTCAAFFSTSEKPARL
jgi:hypothetical protein